MSTRVNNITAHKVNILKNVFDNNINNNYDEKNRFVVILFQEYKRKYRHLP